jgi:crotonobetainyl-CoA:carnitine CoA-transferase CaiB-like acyl-CoA transferase
VDAWDRDAILARSRFRANASPRLGERTDAILARLGYDAAEITALRAGVI